MHCCLNYFYRNGGCLLDYLVDSLFASTLSRILITCFMKEFDLTICTSSLFSSNLIVSGLSVWLYLCSTLWKWIPKTVFIVTHLSHFAFTCSLFQKFWQHKGLERVALHHTVNHRSASGEGTWHCYCPQRSAGR